MIRPAEVKTVKKSRQKVATVLMAAIGLWSPAHSNPDAFPPIPLIVLTDGTAGDTQYSETFSETTNRHRQELLRQIAEDRAGMERDGFIVVSTEKAALSDRLYGEIVSYQARMKESNVLISSRLGYSALNLNNPAFTSATLMGRMPVPSPDDSIHHMFYAFEFNEIGQLVIEELSYATVPDVKITVAAPSGNVGVNGNPGTYIVSVNESGSNASSSLTFLTGRKMFILTTSRRLEVGSDGYRALISLAESL